MGMLLQNWCLKYVWTHGNFICSRGQVTLQHTLSKNGIYVRWTWKMSGMPNVWQLMKCLVPFLGNKVTYITWAVPFQVLHHCLMLWELQYQSCHMRKNACPAGICKLAQTIVGCRWDRIDSTGPETPGTSLCLNCKNWWLCVEKTSLTHTKNIQGCYKPSEVCPKHMNWAQYV